MVVVLLVAVVALPFLLRSAGLGERPADASVSGGDTTASDRLIIVTPHNEQIRAEMAAGFNRWRREAALGSVAFDWRASGGTTDLRKSILAQFTALAREGRPLDDGIGLDLFFGGGDYDHSKLATGIAVRGGGHETATETVSEVANLPAGLLAAAFPQQDIGGEPLLHPERLWVGTALSSFGIVYNRDLLVMLEREPPTTWSDLTDPAYAGWVAAADPGHSGSIAAAFNAVLRREGWDAGWRTLRRVFANARYFASSASRVPVDVSSGEAAAGLCIDFYGRTQAGAVAADGWSGDVEHEGASREVRARTSRLGYADPVEGGRSMTATTADPITLLRGAPHRETAEQFIAWLLSPAGQRLWQAKPGTAGGPLRDALRRQPIRRDLYTPVGRAGWSDPEIDPFRTAVPMPPGTPSYFALVSPVTHAMGIDVHEDLVAAWAALRAMPDDHPRHDEAWALFDALPDDLTPPPGGDAAALRAMTEALDGRSPDQRLLDARRWTRFFRSSYRRVVELSAAVAAGSE